MNEDIVNKLYEIAELLDIQKANQFRVNAFKRAANTIEQLKVPIDDLVMHQGIAGLTKLPNIGEGIANIIYEYVATGEITRLNILKGENDPISFLTKIPGIGKSIADKIHKQLHIVSIEELERAVYDGRLERLANIGNKRLQAIQSWINTVSGKKQYNPYVVKPNNIPSIAVILKIDHLYRQEVAKNALPKIAPTRFNESGEAWLPIMHASQNGWHFTVLYSNSYLAHQLNKNYDWVIIFYHDDHHHGGQCTVVTEYRGKLAGKRIIRGRELECREYYA